ncbi:unnamed protein product [Rotaria socialis]
MAIKQYNQDNISVSVVGVNEEGSSKNLDQLHPSVMYSQIFKGIFLEIEHGEKAVQDYVKYCQQEYQGNTKQLKIIDEFQRNYQASSAIWWYTGHNFTYNLLNGALRALNGAVLIQMGFFLSDLHQQIEKLYKQQVSQYHENVFTVFRGQGLSEADFEKLANNKDGFISFNNFLSTSTNRDISRCFAESNLGPPNVVGILLKIIIDPKVSTTPFAYIREKSCFEGEEEILFSIHTVFRIGDTRKIDNNISIFEADLKLTSDDDPELRQLTDYIRKEVDGTGWYRMGKLLRKIGQFGKAEDLYLALLEQTSNDIDRVLIYKELGWLKDDQGQYTEALQFYDESLKICQATLPEDGPQLAAIYSNTGRAYTNMGDYSKALEFYERSHEIYETSLPLNGHDLANTISRIGEVYDNMGEYSKALEFYEKSHKICETVLPLNHPHFALIFSKIGQVYNKLGVSSKALEFFEKGLEITKRALPPNHPLLAASYNNIGTAYYNMNDYSKALSFLEIAFAIQQKSLPSNHPLTKTTNDNIDHVKKKM